MYQVGDKCSVLKAGYTENPSSFRFLINDWHQLAYDVSPSW
jgi:hypothetical protein